ncbi:MAG: tetratricopeptide repeat protein [Sphingobacteriaceae bacterium]|nr:tetratricopeptide repeat protein [Sphingobacteriaceae bacterium]
MRKIALIFILLFQLNSFGQNRTIDSLKLALKNAKHDTTRCSILYSLIDEYWSDEKVWPKYNEQLKLLSEKNILNGGSLKKVYLKHLAYSLNYIGITANNHGDAPRALEYYKKAMNIMEEAGDREGVAITLSNIGRVYKNQGNITMGLEYYYKSLMIFEEIGDKDGMANTLNNIAVVIYSQGDIQKALVCFQEILKIKSEVGDKEGIAKALGGIGGIYANQGKVVMALENYNKSLNIQQDIGDKMGISRSLNYIGNIYKRQGEIQKALDYYHKSLKINEEIDNKGGIAYTLSNIANSMMEKGELKGALIYAVKGMQTAKEIGYPENVKNSAAILKSIYQKQNKYKEAFEMYELEIKMRDSINNQETQKAAIKKQMQYTYEKQEEVAKAEHKKELEKQQAVAEEKNTRQNIIIGSVAMGLLLVLIFAGYVFKTLKATRKQKALIEHKNKEIEEKQKEILDSIQYARRIQMAQIPSEKRVGNILQRLKKC